MSLETRGAAAKRGNRALAHVVGIERGEQGQATALLLWRRFRRGHRGGRRTDRAVGAATDLARPGLPGGRAAPLQARPALTWLGSARAHASPPPGLRRRRGACRAFQPRPAWYGRG